MQFTKAIHLISGEVITITEEEFKAVAESIEKKPEGFLSIQGQFINKRSIAKIGTHTASADMKKWGNANIERTLLEGGRYDLVEAKRKLVKDKAMQENAKDKDFERRLVAGDPEAIRIYNAIPDEPKKLMTAAESEKGDAEYWVDELGEKHFS